MIPTLRQERFSVSVSFFAGLVFALGFLFYFFIGGWSIFFGEIQKVTTQSNIAAFFITCWYLKKPNSRVFQNNVFFIVVGAVLLTAGLGFWLLLFPIYFIGLGEYLIDSTAQAYSSTAVGIFLLFWNHTVTQSAYLYMLKNIFARSTKWKLFPAKYSSCVRGITIYFVLILLLYLIYSYLDLVPPAYGVLSNFNWYKQYATGGDSHASFNLKALLTSTSCSFLIAFLSASYLWWTSIKLNPITSEERRMNLNF